MLKLCIGTLAAATLLGAAENVVFQAKTVKDFLGANPTLTAKDGVFRISAPKAALWLKSTKMIPVNPAKKYFVTATVRLLPGAVAAKSYLYIGAVELDSKGAEIPSHAANYVPASFTSLTKAAKKGDRSVTVKDGSKWKKGAWQFIAFNAKADRSDVPNFDLIAVKSVVKGADGWLVTLGTPLTRDVPAGTGVRNHFSAATYNYIYYTANLPAQWKNAGGKLSGISGSAEGGKFRAGTKFFRFYIGTVSGAPTFAEIKDIKVVEQ